MEKNIMLFLLILITICSYISLNIFAQNRETGINREQFVNHYAVKIQVEGSNLTSYTNVRIVEGKLCFNVNEGETMSIDYEETSAKEIKKNIEYHFDAFDYDSGSNRIYSFKKKGNRYELTFDY